MSNACWCDGVSQVTDWNKRMEYLYSSLDIYRCTDARSCLKTQK